MSTPKLITLICWIIVAVVLIGLVFWFLTGNLFGFRTGFKINVPAFNISSLEHLTGPFNEVGTFTVPAGDLDSIDVNWVAGSASITPYDGDVVKVTEYAQRALKDDEKFVCSAAGRTLDVKYCSPGMKVNILVKKLEVLVPASLAAKLNVLDIDATSADLKISDFTADTFNVSETSGESAISGISATSSDIHSVSGTIDITNMTTSTLKLGTVSGEILLKDVTADSLTSNTTSGEQEMSGAFKDVDAGSVSGEISVTSSVNPDRMRCGTTSGSITVTIPGGTNNLSVSSHTTSGRFTSEIPVITGGSGPADYSFSSVSGDIRLKAAA
jgi:DUF4097 and DUF4098 domain-containing protein YvlB